MKKLLIAICILLLAITGCENSLPISENNIMVWKILYNTNSSSSGISFFEESTVTDKEGFTIPKDYNTEVIKELSSEKVFDSANIINSCRLDDGLIVLTSLQTQEASVTKLDMSGKVVWEKFINTFYYPASEITLLNNGNIVFAMLSSNEDGIIFCYNQNGQQEWKYTYEDNLRSRVQYIFQDKSGNLMCSGLATKDSSDDEPDVVITKLSTQGEFIDEAYLGGKYREYLEGTVYNESTGLVITGRSYSDDGELINCDNNEYLAIDYVASIDESLNVNWVYNPKKPISYDYNQIQVQDGLIVLSGTNRSDNDIRTVYYYQIFDSKGTLIQETNMTDKSEEPKTAIGFTEDKKVVFVFNSKKGSKITIKNLQGKTIKELNNELTNPKKVIPTDEGGFIVQYEHPIGYLPQLRHLSVRLKDTATVLSCYDTNGKLIWQKNYDGCQIHLLTDYPNSDS